MRLSIKRVVLIASIVFLIIIVSWLLSGRSLRFLLPQQAQIALDILFRNLPVVYLEKAEVKGFAEFWCVILGGSDVYTLGSVQILEDFDGGWNASWYQDRHRWEARCGPVPGEYVSRLAPTRVSTPLPE